MNKNIFREYDIRGVYPTDINEDIAYTIGKSYGSYIQEKLNKNTCVVGEDIRYSSKSLTLNLIKGIIDSGCNVVNLGICTTPMYYYACIKTGYIIGIMVTASHNPKDDNGFKFSFDELGNARGEMIYDFRDYTLAGNFKDGHGKIAKYNILNDYIKLITDNIHLGDKKLKVVFDCGNATTGPFIKDIISNFNIEPIYLFDEVDPTFPNHHPDPAVEDNMRFLKEKVKEVNADLGIGYDGDGDRLGVVNNLGEYVKTDLIMSLLAKQVVLENDNKNILYDIKCSKVIEDTVLSVGGTPHLYRTGASYTRYKTVLEKYSFGGELSGHFTFNDRFPGFDSGIYASLRLIEILSKETKSLSDLINELPVYYNTPEIKIHVPDEDKFIIVERMIEYCKNNNYEINTIDGVKVTYPHGWALVRASNTGPNLTLRFEADNPSDLAIIHDEYINLIDKWLS